MSNQECNHRECELVATQHIKSEYMEVDVCQVHFVILEHAVRHEGGYSTANSKDNIFGWRYLTLDPLEDE